MADEAKAPDKNAKPDGAPAAKRGGMLPVAIAAVVSIAGAVTVGIAGFPDHESPSATVQPTHKETVIMPVPKVLVNLADDGRGNRLLQAEVSLELETDDTARANGRFNELLPKVQDRLISVLSGYTATDLSGAAAKDFAKVRIIDEMNRDVFTDDSLRASRVLFTEFVVQ